MKLTEEQVKQIMTKVHDDLKLDYGKEYPIFYRAHEKDEKDNELGIAYWGCGYDYRNPEAVGDEWMGAYTEWIIWIDDEKGEAISYHHYTGHYEINLVEDKYKVLKQMYREKKPD